MRRARALFVDAHLAGAAARSPASARRAMHRGIDPAGCSSDAGEERFAYLAHRHRRTTTQHSRCARAPVIALDGRASYLQRRSICRRPDAPHRQSPAPQRGQHGLLRAVPCLGRALRRRARRSCEPECRRIGRCLSRCSTTARAKNALERARAAHRATCRRLQVGDVSPSFSERRHASGLRPDSVGSTERGRRRSLIELADQAIGSIDVLDARRAAVDRRSACSHPRPQRSDQ